MATAKPCPLPPCEAHIDRATFDAVAAFWTLASGSSPVPPLWPRVAHLAWRGDTELLSTPPVVDPANRGTAAKSPIARAVISVAAGYLSSSLVRARCLGYQFMVAKILPTLEQGTYNAIQYAAINLVDAGVARGLTRVMLEERVDMVMLVQCVKAFHHLAWGLRCDAVKFDGRKIFDGGAAEALVLLAADEGGFPPEVRDYALKAAHDLVRLEVPTTFYGPIVEWAAARGDDYLAQSIVATLVSCATAAKRVSLAKRFPSLMACITGIEELKPPVEQADAKGALAAHEKVRCLAAFLRDSPEAVVRVAVAAGALRTIRVAALFQSVTFCADAFQALASIMASRHGILAAAADADLMNVVAQAATQTRPNFLSAGASKCIIVAFRWVGQDPTMAQVLLDAKLDDAVPAVLKELHAETRFYRHDFWCVAGMLRLAAARGTDVTIMRKLADGHIEGLLPTPEAARRSHSGAAVVAAIRMLCVPHVAQDVSDLAQSITRWRRSLMEYDRVASSDEDVHDEDDDDGESFDT